MLGCAITLADIEMTQGRLGDAQRTFERALELAGHGRPPPLRGTADMHVGLSRVAWERDDLAGAADHLRRADGSASPPACRSTRTGGGSRWRSCEQPKATSTAALALLDEAERVYVGDFSPNVRPVPATRARVLAAHGRRRRSARLGARARAVAADDDLSLPARVRARHPGPGSARARTRERVRGRSEEATGLLDRLLAAAEAGGRTGTVIEILVLRALASRSAR